MSDKVVALIGSLDTKGEEYAYLRDRLADQDVATLVIDTGILGAPAFAPDISADEVAAAGGEDRKSLVARNDRGHGVAVMCAGAAAIVARLHREGRIHGVIAMGGGGGTAVGTAAMRALPVGVPKVMVSTVASGDVGQYVGVKDIVMMPSIVDVAGINRLSARIIANAAGAVAGMVKMADVAIAADKPMIAATMFGVTTECVTYARRILEQAGYEVLVFHAVGSGGRTMEDLIRGGYFAGVLDLTTTELADELAGGVLSAGPERLTAAGETAIPQVVSAGALDMVNFWARDTVPERYRDRKLHAHNPQVTLMRTTEAENAELGRIVAEKLNRAHGPTVFMMPLKGVSAMDVQGGPFHDPRADAAFLRALRANLSDRVELVEVDAAINDRAFAEAAAKRLVEMLAG
jgi:uncharacterized protein (UPF0261 family)